jgi:voltage-gated potassium channel
MQGVAAPATSAQQRARYWRRMGRRLRLLTGLALLILIFCPLAVWLAERGRNPNIKDLGAGYQWLGRTLFETTTAYRLYTGPGFVVYYIVRVAGVSLVAFGTATIASRLVTTIILRGKGLGATKATGHVLICGWSTKAPEVLRELQAKHGNGDRRIVVLARHADDPTKDDAVEFLHGDPADGADLTRAGLANCDTAIVLADEFEPGSSAQDRDARSLLICLAIESINPNVYTCVEVLRPENRQHFIHAHADEMVVSAELSGALLGGAARTHGLSRLIGELITRPEGQEFYRIPVPPDLVGTTVGAALRLLKERFDALLVGFDDGGKDFSLNPSAARTIKAGDTLVVITADPSAFAQAMPEGAR